LASGFCIKEMNMIKSLAQYLRERNAATEARCAEIDAEQARELLAWQAEQPEKIDYVAANYQDGWL